MYGVFLMINLFANILGTLKSIKTFQIGGRLAPIIKSFNNAKFQFRNSEDTTFVEVEAKGITNNYTLDQVPNLFDLSARIPFIEFSYATGSAPTAGTNSNKFGFIHSGTDKGKVVYDNGTSLIEIEDIVSSTISTKVIITGEVNLDIFSLYIRSGSNFIKISEYRANKSIIIPYTFTDTIIYSDISLSELSRVNQISNIIYTAFDGALPTIKIELNGNTEILSTNESNLLINEEFILLKNYNLSLADSGQIKLTLNPDSSSVGNGVIIINYIEPIN